MIISQYSNDVLHASFTLSDKTLEECKNMFQKESWLPRTCC